MAASDTIYLTDDEIRGLIGLRIHTFVNAMNDGEMVPSEAIKTGSKTRAEKIRMQFSNLATAANMLIDRIERLDFASTKPAQNEVAN